MRGAREHNLKNVNVAFPRDRLVVITGPVRERQVQPRLRHHLRRGPAPLRREPVRVRPPVPGPDGEAGRRPDRRAVAGHLHRPEGREQEPAVHGRHGHRDLRLPAPAVRAHRPPALPQLRPRDRAPDGQPDRGPGARAARGDAPAGAGPAGQGPQDRGRPRLRGRPQAGLRPRPRGRRPVRPGRGPDARQVQAPHDRGRGGPVRRPPRGGAGGLGAGRRRPADRPGDRARPSRTRTPRASRTRSRPRCGWARASW